MIKHPFNSEWFKYNDEVVEKVTKPPGYEKLPRVTNTKAPNDMNSCYALIYRKVGELFYSCEPPLVDICQPWRDEVNTWFPYLAPACLVRERICRADWSPSGEELEECQASQTSIQGPSQSFLQSQGGKLIVFRKRNSRLIRIALRTRKN